jgi:hypothetical protein
MPPKRKQLVITGEPIPVDNVKLGSLIPTFQNPTQEAVAPLVPTAEDFHTAPQTNYRSLVKHYGNTALSPHLAVFGIDISKDNDVEVVIEATRGVKYELKDPQQWFKQLCTDVRVQEWIQRRARMRKDIFLITGYRTFNNARTTTKAKHGREVGGKVDVPVDAIVAATAAALPISLGMDVGGEVKVDKSTTVEEEYTSPGEQIYSVQYRRVNVSWFKSSSKDPVSLDDIDKAFWKDVITTMGEEKEADMVKAELATALLLGVETEKSFDEGCEDEYLIVQGDESKKDDI